MLEMWHFVIFVNQFLVILLSMASVCASLCFVSLRFCS